VKENKIRWNDKFNFVSFQVTSFDFKIYIGVNLRNIYLQNIPEILLVLA